MREPEKTTVTINVEVITVFDNKIQWSLMTATRTNPGRLSKHGVEPHTPLGLSTLNPGR